MVGKYFCEIHVFMRSGVPELEFTRTCKTKKDAKELASWIHRQYAEGASAEVLTMEMPCQNRNQAPRTLSFRSRDICAITTVVGAYAEDCDNKEGFKIEPGFRDTASDYSEPFTVGSGQEDELAASAKGNN